MIGIAIAVATALAWTPPLELAISEVMATAWLEEIRTQFPQRAKAESIAALETLIADAPAAGAGGRALLWLGDLARQAGERARAGDFYQRAYRQFDGEIHRLGARGLGDVALAEGHYRGAERLYDESLRGAGAVLYAELSQKRALAVRLWRRWLGAIAAWTLLIGGLAFFVVRGRLWRRENLGLPVEAAYVVPLYAVFIAGCLGRDSGVLRALVIGALGSTALIVVSGLAGRRATRGGWLHGSVLVVANLALFYVAVHHAGILDTLLVTLGVDSAVMG